jgi:two-component system KDP operon response regulator KdpE
MDQNFIPTVLVIEDDADLRSLYRDVFEGEGWSVATVPTPDTDLSWVHIYAPEAIVLDLVYGGDTDLGMRFLRRLRTEDYGMAIPVAICSGWQRLLQRHESEIAQLGATMLPKPFDLGDLLRAVHRPPARTA